MTSQTTVLIIDDSAADREVLSAVYQQDPRLQMLPPAGDVFLAAERMRWPVPDVIVFDGELPRRHGICLPRRLMAQHLIPVVICSGVVPLDSPVMRQAREAGAVDCIAKPRLRDIEGCREVGAAIGDTSYAVSRVPVASLAAHSVVPKRSADVVMGRVQRSPLPADTPPVLVIGTSTGGTEALSFLIRQLPASVPGIVIVPHLPAFFTAWFGDRLNRLSALFDKEAAPGDEVGTGRVNVAGGNGDVVLRRCQRRDRIDLLDGPPVRPLNKPGLTPLAFCLPAWAMTAPLACSNSDIPAPSPSLRTAHLPPSLACRTRPSNREALTESSRSIRSPRLLSNSSGKPTRGSPQPTISQQRTTDHATLPSRFAP